MTNLKTSDLDLTKTTTNTRDISAYFDDNTKNKRKGADDHQHFICGIEQYFPCFAIDEATKNIKKEILV